MWESVFCCMTFYPYNPPSQLKSLVILWQQHHRCQSQNVSNLLKGSLCYAVVLQPNSNCIYTLKQTEVKHYAVHWRQCNSILFYRVSQIINGSNKSMLKLQIYVISMVWSLFLSLCIKPQTALTITTRAMPNMSAKHLLCVKTKLLCSQFSREA